MNTSRSPSAGTGCHHAAARRRLHGTVIADEEEYPVDERNGAIEARRVASSDQVADVVAAAAHPDPQVRYAAVGHPLASREVLELLAEDDDVTVAADADARLRLARSTLGPDVRLRLAGIASLAVELAEALDRDPDEDHTTVLNDLGDVAASLARLASLAQQPAGS